jgi:RNA polymerase sigma-70 factor (ECF subfamily)
MVGEPDLPVLKTPLNSAAVGDLYDRFYEPIYRYCLRRLYFRHLAEDAVSGVFLTIAQRIRDFRGRNLRDFQAWLYVIAGNHVSQLLRQKLRDERLIEQIAEHAWTQETGSPPWRWAALYRSLLTLDEEQQHLIALRFFEKLSHDQIARIVGSRVGTVRVRIHRALMELRPTLQRELDDACTLEMNDGH